MKSVTPRHHYESSYIFRICLQECEEKEFKGVVYTSVHDETIMFVSFDDFIIKMDKYMDCYGPQSFQDKRTLSDQQSVSSFHTYIFNEDRYDRLMTMEGEMDTYTICMIARRNTEWQGMLYHKEFIIGEFSNII